MVVAPFAVALVFVVFAAFFVAPFVVLWKVAEARGRSPHFAWFALWGIPGLVVGLLVLIALQDLRQRPA